MRHGITSKYFVFLAAQKGNGPHHAGVGLPPGQEGAASPLPERRRKRSWPWFLSFLVSAVPGRSTCNHRHDHRGGRSGSHRETRLPPIRPVPARTYVTASARGAEN